MKLRKHEVREGTLLALKDGEVVRRERFRPDHEYVEAHPLPAVRAPAERDFCLSALATARRRPPRASRRRDRDALVEQPLAHEELERRPGAAPRLEQPVDLPLGQQRLVREPRLAPVAELRQPSERPRQDRALLDRALETLLGERDVEAGLAQRRRQRPERVPVERLRRASIPRRCA